MKAYLCVCWERRRSPLALMLLPVRRERLSGSDRPSLATVAWSLTETDVASLRNISGSKLPRLNLRGPQEESRMRRQRTWEILTVEENPRSPEGKPKKYFWYGKNCPVPMEAETDEFVNRRKLIADSAEVHKNVVTLARKLETGENHDRK